jgi:hypothetical protein
VFECIDDSSSSELSALVAAMLAVLLVCNGGQSVRDWSYNIDIKTLSLHCYRLILFLLRTALTYYVVY